VNHQNNEYVTLRRSIAVREETDVAVFGGGPAGIAAAIASARHGAKTTLFEQYGFLGGMATAGLVGPFMTSFGVDGRERVLTGIFQELVDRMIKLGGAIDPGEIRAGSDYASFITPSHHNVTPFDPEIMKYVASEMVLEAAVNLRFHSRFVDVISARRKIGGAIFADKAGLGIVKAKNYVDATGDADLVAFAGGAFLKGRANDGRLQPVTMFFRIGNVDDDQINRWHLEHPNEALFATLVSEARQNGDWPEDCPRYKVGLYKTLIPGQWRVNTSRVLNIDGTVPESLTAGEIAGRRQVMTLVHFLREYCPGMATCVLIDTAAQVGIRETRIIKGLYTLTKDDVRNARSFQDGIARYAFFMDVHNPSGSGDEIGRSIEDFTKEDTHYLFVRHGNYYEIPYRCLVPVGLDNVIVAGRCISTDRMANGSVRVMPACFGTGQAAGTAAAEAARSGFPFQQLDGNVIRQALREDECYV
jgi:hypothetical protein